MKILLIKDIQPIGKKGDVLDVSQGYGRNYIIPQKFGVLATRKNIIESIRNKKKMEENTNKKKEIVKNIYNKINNKNIKINVKTGKKGEIFTAVHKKDVEEKIFSMIKSIDTNNMLEIDDIKTHFKPIKEIGIFDIKIDIGKGNYKRILSIKLEILSDKSK